MSKHELFTEITYHRNAEFYFLRLKPLKKRVWLDSGKPHSAYGRFDILSAAPSQELFDPTIEELENAFKKVSKIDCLSILEEHNIPFWGGLIGFFNYEYNESEYKIQPRNQSRSASTFGLFEWALIQDHKLKKAYLVFLPCCDESLKERVKNTIYSEVASDTGEFCVRHLSNDMSQQHYLKTIEKIKKYIVAGDTYQINFSQRFSGDFEGEADAAYITLREALPSPFSAYIELGDDRILSFSPERFIRVQDQHAITQPIKGTAPRGKNLEEDTMLADRLRRSEKNRAENVMIVDLLRNDFSKSCEPHSVRVPSLFALESYANVHHLVSTVEGKLKQNTSILEFFIRCFPGGSITGAPKKRSMEIIHELEELPRNIYCGSICYLSALGNFDSSITIRTLLIQNNKVYCWGGGGIVADSDPHDEYQESLQKVKVLMEALKDNSSSTIAS